MKIKCMTEGCKTTWEVPDDDRPHPLYCSIECACYDHAYNVKTGWNEKRLKEVKKKIGA